MAKKPINEPENDFPAKLSQPAKRALFGAGYFKLEQLTHVKAADILKLHGMGKKGINMLREALEQQGLSFADDE